MCYKYFKKSCIIHRFSILQNSYYNKSSKQTELYKSVQLMLLKSFRLNPSGLSLVILRKLK